MHHATSTAAQQQRARVKSYRSNSDSYQFFNLLTSDALLDPVEALLPEHRERRFPPTETLSMFLAQMMSADRSCQHIVNQAAIHRLAAGLSPCSPRTGGYCRARQRLPLEMVMTLTRHIGDVIDQQVPGIWRWHDKRVRIVDGTTMTLPDTPANQAEYPQQRVQKPGLGFPICRVVGITCLATGALVNAAVGHYHGKGGDEQSLLRSIQDTFEPGDLVLGDAFFSTYFFIAAMQARGVDILMEQHGARRRSTDFRHGKRLGSKDHLMVITKPEKRPQWMTPEQYAQAPEAITLRECKAGGKLLITTLVNPKTVPKADLKDLYASRWHVELDIRHIKETLAIGALSGKTPAMARKEIWVSLLAYNLIRLMMAQSALVADVIPRTLSFKHCLRIWLEASRYIDTLDDRQQHCLLELMAQVQVGNRPGRKEPRAVKRRPKPFPLLTKPRREARAEVGNLA